MKPEPDPLQKPLTLPAHLFIVSAIVISLLLTIIGLLLYQNSLLKKQVPTPIPSPTPTASTIIGPTANWKTYINPPYGYQISYPSDFQLVENKYADNILIRSNKTIKVGTPKGEFIEKDSYEMNINFLTNNPKENSWFVYPNVSENQTIYSNNFQVYFSGFEGTGEWKYLFKKNNKEFLVFSVSQIKPYYGLDEKLYSNKEEYLWIKNNLDLTRQILSTFKFD